MEDKEESDDNGDECNNANEEEKGDDDNNDWTVGHDVGNVFLNRNERCLLEGTNVT